MHRKGVWGVESVAPLAFKIEKSHRLSFLTWIFQNEDLHHTLSETYDQISRDRQLMTGTTWADATC